MLQPKSYENSLWCSFVATVRFVLEAFCVFLVMNIQVGVQHVIGDVNPWPGFGGATHDVIPADEVHSEFFPLRYPCDKQLHESPELIGQFLWTHILADKWSIAAFAVMFAVVWHNGTAVPSERTRNLCLSTFVLSVTLAWPFLGLLHRTWGLLGKLCLPIAVVLPFMFPASSLSTTRTRLALTCIATVCYPGARIVIDFSHHLMHHSLHFELTKCKILPWTTYLLCAVCLTDSLHLTDSFESHYEHHFAIQPVSHAGSNLPDRHGFAIFVSKMPLLSNILFDFQDRDVPLFDPFLLGSCQMYISFLVPTFLMLSVMFGSFAYLATVLLLLVNLNRMVPREYHASAFASEIYAALVNETSHIDQDGYTSRIPEMVHIGAPFVPLAPFSCVSSWQAKMELMRINGA